ncbi:efflux pump antibiotic resistance protein [Usnea florida]
MPRSLTRQEKHPELFARDIYTDPRSRTRKVPMEVLCLGYMRTGTACESTFHTAFSLLGVPCCHSFSLYNHVQDCTMWISAFDAKFAGKGKPFTRTEWDQLLSDYGAVTDVPALAFSEDLISAYPEAKVVLMERDIEKWYKSFDDAVAKVMWAKWGHLIASLDPWFVGPIRDVHLRWARDWMGVKSMEDMRTKAKYKYREHYKMIRTIVPKERLLEYKLGSGWEPLCDFLGKEIPDIEFPRVNETASMHEKVTIIAVRGIRNLATRVLLWIGPLLFMLLLVAIKFR